jgi:hypothetical protein
MKRPGPKKRKSKSFAQMSVKEIHALESKYGVAIGARRPTPPQHWRIEDFFVAAAVRKGVKNLPTFMADPETTRIVEQNEKEYRIDWHLKDSSRYAKSFTIHADGTWIYASGPTVVHGKLQPPHARGWVDKMITKGTPGEFARADWTYYFKLRNLK